MQFLPMQEISFRESDQEVALEKVLEQHEDWPARIDVRANRGTWCWAEAVAEWFDMQE